MQAFSGIPLQIYDPDCCLRIYAVCPPLHRPTKQAYIHDPLRVAFVWAGVGVGVGGELYFRQSFSYLVNILITY
jgi:hypothetical protein